MGRRDFIVLWLQALLLTLFPWLRTEQGVEAAGRVADEMVPKYDRAIFKGGEFKISMNLKGYELNDEMYAKLREAIEKNPGDARGVLMSGSPTVDFARWR